MKNRLVLAVALATFCCVSWTADGARACTGIGIKAKDGAVIRGRSMEFAVDIQSKILIIPRGKQYTGTAPNNKTGLKWKTKYGIVGANFYNLDHIVDGLNEKGLYVGGFYFPDYAEYQAVTPDEADRTIAPTELGTWLLSSFATVAEAKKGIPNVKVAGTVLKQMGIVPPIHYILQDATGDCIVVEYVKGQVQIHDNPLWVITNSPTFDWHITNLRNYVNLSAVNVPPVELSGIKLGQIGQGSGFLGLPGDYTPPSRFVRAVAFSQSAAPPETADEGVRLAIHIMNTFDIFVGAVREKDPDGKTHMELTEWTTFYDLANKRLFFSTYGNHRIRMVDLSKFDFDDKSVKKIEMRTPEVFEDVSNQAK
jgi:choloylglycine hydrolase